MITLLLLSAFSFGFSPSDCSDNLKHAKLLSPVAQNEIATFYADNIRKYEDTGESKVYVVIDNHIERIYRINYGKKQNISLLKKAHRLYGETIISSDNVFGYTFAWPDLFVEVSLDGNKLKYIQVCRSNE